MTAAPRPRGRRNVSCPILAVFLFVTVFGISPALAGTVDLPRTGQITTYAAGDDGDIQAGVPWPEPRFIDNGDGTVTDLLTGLMWTKDANLCGIKTWADALTSASGCTVGAYNDWRLPNINELESLVNAEVSNTAEWLITQGFSNVQASNYWSSSTQVNDNDICAAWSVLMDRGLVHGFVKYGRIYVWPVRSGQSGSVGPSVIWRTGQTTSYAEGDDGDLQMGAVWPEPRFMDHGDGTVTDNLTGLMWMKDANLYGRRTWTEALSDANDCAVGEYTDWRLPNRKELFSLMDRSQHSPCLPAGHPFTNVQERDYWSSSTYAPYTANAWRAYFRFGGVDHNSKTLTKYVVWPVRSGQVGSFGHLIISIEPEATRNAGAQWRIGGGNGFWYNSGQSIPALAGRHTVEFKSLNGWGAPANRTVDVSAGGIAENEGTYLVDNCPDDPAKLEPGACGCGNPDTDTDGDGASGGGGDGGCFLKTLWK